jgi:Neuraminidase (sialidase)
MFRLTLFLIFAILVSTVRGQVGDVVLEYQPTKEFPRNSEGSFVQLKSGRILYYYTQFYGGANDASAARIAGIYSDDAGRTWSEPKTVLEHTGGLNIMSVSLLRLQSGAIAFFYLEKKSHTECRPYVRLSTDEAATWSEPALVVPAPGYFVLNNDRVIQLASGRLVVPVAYHRIKLENPGPARAMDSRAIAFWYLSDDEGKTWREATTWWALPVQSGSGLQEPGAVELADGKLFGWSRTDTGFQYGFTSADGGKTWTPPAPTTLASPLSPASIKRLPGSADLLAIYNDHSGRHPFTKGRRTPLVSAISKDGGATWSPSRVIEGDPEGGFCYTAIHFVDDAVLLAYCAGDTRIGQLNRLRIRRIPLSALTAP